MRGLIGCTLIYSAILIGYLGGLIGSLLGPGSLAMGGMAAFVATIAMFALIVAQRPAKTGRIGLPDGGLASFYPRVWSLLGPFYVVAAGCLLAGAVGLVVMMIASGNDGVASGTGPLLTPRSAYYLCNHGRVTEVTRARYLAAGMSFVVGWHAFGAFFACIGFHRVLFGRAKDLKQRWEEHCWLKRSGRRRRPYWY